MVLIKNLCIEQYTTSTNKTTSYSYGLFECNYCKKEIKLRLSKGKNQKSCGSKECSAIAHSDGYNRELSANNIGNTKDNRTKDKYYNGFKELYRLHKDSTLKGIVDSFDEFYNVSYSEYVSIKKYASKIRLTSLNNNIVFNDVLKEKKEEILKEISKIDFDIKTEKEINNLSDGKLKALESRKKTLSEFINEYKFNTLSLSYSTNIVHNQISKRIINLKESNHPDFESFTYEIETNSPFENTYIMSEHQYNILKIILNGTSKKSPTNIYIIKASTGEYKIGISSNIENRLKSIVMQSAPSVDYSIIYNKHIGTKSQALESRIHKKLKEFHLRGEWFSLSTDLLNKVKSTINNHDEFFKKEEENEYLIAEEKRKKRIEDIKNKHINSHIKRKNILLDKLKILEEKSIERDSIIIDVNLKKIKIKEEKEIIKKEQIKEEYIKTKKTQASVHGASGTKLYTSWQSMKSRAKQYNIPIEPEWLDSYDNWFSDIGSKYIDGYEFSLIKKEFGFIKDNIEVITTLEARKKNTSKSVIKIDKDGLELEIYDSAVDASDKTDKATPGHITACCRGKRNSHAGFKWKYAKAS